MAITRVKTSIEIMKGSKCHINCTVCGIKVIALLDTGADNFVLVKSVLDEINRYNKDALRDTGKVIQLLGLNESSNDICRMATGCDTMVQAIKHFHGDYKKVNEMINNVHKKRFNKIFEGELLLGDDLLIKNIPFVGTTSTNMSCQVIIPYTFIKCFKYNLYNMDADTFLDLECDRHTEEALIAFYKMEDGIPYAVLAQSNLV